MSSSFENLTEALSLLEIKSNVPTHVTHQNNIQSTYIMSVKNKELLRLIRSLERQTDLNTWFFSSHREEDMAQQYREAVFLWKCFTDFTGKMCVSLSAALQQPRGWSHYTDAFLTWLNLRCRDRWRLVVCVGLNLTIRSRMIPSKIKIKCSLFRNTVRN